MQPVQQNGLGLAAGRHVSGGCLPLAFPTVCIWGANRGVGKTLVSAGLARAAAAQQVRGLSKGSGVRGTVHACVLIDPG